MKYTSIIKQSGKWPWLHRASFCIALILLLTLATVSFAHDPAGTLAQTPGTLTMSAVDNPAFPTITLNGTTQTINDTIDIDVKDLRGTGAGWHLEVTSTTFTDGSHTLPNTALAITGVTFACDGACIPPTNNNSYSLVVPADVTSPASVEFFEAAALTGLGDFTIRPNFALSVPANAYAGTYNSTITITIANTP